MEQYLIGKIIKEFRRRNNLSQEKLAGTSCAVSTLSRIEHGEQIPNWKLVEALFSKMGMASPLHSVPMSETDLKRWNLEYEITNSVANSDYETNKMLEEYYACSSVLNTLEQQFYIFQKAIYNRHHNGTAEEILSLLEYALQLSITRFTPDMNLSGRLLTKTERLILNNIALVLYDLNRKDQAETILEFLIQYFETQTISETEKAKDYPVILFNLSNWKGLDGKYEEALALSEKGINECITYGQLLIFPYLLFNKGYCLLGLKQTEDGKKSIEHAFNFMDETGKHEDVVFASKKIKEIFGIDI